jgi:hypothetical protein
MNRSVAASLAIAAAFGVAGHAQPSAPIYLQYDGFVRNTDAHTITLSFGYFNQNHTDVTIQPGADNTFLPGPADRQQPVVFREGRHRFACTIVVAEEFAGPLQWQVTFGGKPAVTTGKVLLPLYELEAASERRVMAGLDPKTAPRNVCANHAPAVQVGSAPGANAGAEADAPPGARAAQNRALATSVGRELALPGVVTDDDLPRGSRVAVSWKKLSGPGEVTFSSPTSAASRVKFSVAGAYELELSASDGDKTSAARIRVTAGAAIEPLAVR